MSNRIKSGLSSLAFSMASRPLAASPHTVNPEQLSSRARTAARMAAWSSTMRMESKLRSSGEPQRSSYGAEAQRCGQFTGYQLSKSHGLVTIGYPLLRRASDWPFSARDVNQSPSIRVVRPRGVQSLPIKSRYFSVGAYWLKPVSRIDRACAGEDRTIPLIQRRSHPGSPSKYARIEFRRYFSVEAFEERMAFIDPPAARYSPLAIPSRQLCSVQCSVSAKRAVLHFSRVRSAYFLASSNWPCCPTRVDNLSAASKCSIAALA